MTRLRRWLSQLWAWSGRHKKVVAVLLLPLGILIGAAWSQHRLTHAASPGGLPRGAAAPKSGADKTVDAAVILARTAEKAVEEAIASYTARTRGEALVYLAEMGNLDAAKYLLAQGEDLNSRDRRGRTPLIGAAAGGKVEVVEYLLAQAKVDRQVVDLAGNNAFVHALAAKSPGTASRLKDAGISWPSLHQGETNPTPEAQPRAITEDDVTSFDGVLTILGQTMSYDGKSGQLSSIVQSEQPTLWAAVNNLDCGEQLNEPEIQQAALAERRQAIVLLLNRLVGSTHRASLLYECERWRHVKLPDGVMTEVRALRSYLKEHPEKVNEDGVPITSAEALVRMRKVNGLIVDYVLGSCVRVHFGGSGTASAPRPVPPELLPASAPAFVKSPLTEADLQYKTLSEVQDMINEVMAAGGQDFGTPRLNKTYRDKGYQQLTKDPVLTDVQKANLRLLSAKRKQLKAVAAGSAGPQTTPQ